MQGNARRWLLTALWPLSVWPSLKNVDDHPADSYVERTSPIVAAAIGFWLIIIVIGILWFANGPSGVFQVFLFFLPAIYVIGIFLYANREENFPRE